MAKRTHLSLRDLSLRWGEARNEKRLDFSSFSNQINIIKGANASGKSTTANAIKQIIWRKEPPRYIHQSAISAHADCGDDTWQFAWKYGTDSIKQNGASANRTALSAGTAPDRYYLSLQNLLTEDDSELARRIYNEMLGGYDLEKAKNELGFSGNIKNRSISEYRNLEEAIAHETELKQKFDLLADDEKKLEKLNAERKDLAAKKNRNAYLSDLRAFLTIKSNLRETQQQLDQFDAQVKFDKLTGEEWEKIDDLQKEISETESKLGIMEEDLAKLDAKQNELRLPKEKPKLSLVRKWKSQIDELSTKIDTLAEKKATLEEHKEKLATHRNALNGLSSEQVESDWIEPEYEFWHKLENTLANYLDKDIQRKNLTERRQWFSKKIAEMETPVSSGQLSDLLMALKQIEPDQPNDDTEPETQVSLKTTLIVLAVLLAAVFAGAFIHWGISILAVLLAGFALFFIGRNSNQPTESDPYTLQKEKITSSNLVLIDDWSAASLDKGINLVLEKKRELEEYKTLQNEIGQLDEKLSSVRDDLQTIEAELKKLTEPYGDFPDFDSGAALFRYLTRWNDVHNELAAFRGLKANFKTLEKQIQDDKNQIVQTISQCVGPNNMPDEFEHLEHWLVEFEDDLESFNEIKTEKETIRSDINHIKSDIERLKSDKKELFDLFPDSAELSDIKTWCKQRDRHIELTQQKAQFISQKQLKEQDIVAHDHHREDDLQKTFADIETEKSTIEEELKQLAPIEEEINDIEKELYKVKSSHDLQDARRQTEQAWSELMERKQENLSDIAGNLLYSTLKEQTRHEQTPELLQEANRWFNQFTNGMYRLRVITGENGQMVPEFQAETTDSGTYFNIEQLSSGTRIQLLLAVRLAYIEHQEGDVKLPLLIDELLANSDDQRAQQIINALITVAKKGRQIFYFTAQSDEVIKWKKVANTHTVTIKEIALSSSLASESTYSEETDASPIEIPNIVINVPKPGTMDHASYGEKLDVPVFNPQQDDIALLHLWYALDNQPLYRLLKLDLRRWNQLSTLIASNTDLPLTDSLIEKLNDTMPVVGTYVDLRKTGHPVRINEMALMDSGAISDTFREPVSKKLEECRFNPELLLRAIERGEVSRFRNDKLEELRAFLYEEGYLKYEEKLTSEEIHQALTLHLAKHPEADRSYVQKIIDRIEDRFTDTVQSKKSTVSD